jgi:L-alanine-DL-glutamate epimerase-like enolase superfamily enzyme
MKITSVEIYMLQFKRQKPIVCRVNTDEGIYGWGEAGIAYGIGQNAAFGMLQDLSKYIIGKDPMDNEVIWEDLLKTTFWAQAGGPIVFAGLSAIDIALMDIKGKKLNTPVYNLLGGRHNTKLRAYASQIHMGWKDEEFRHASVQDYVDICKYCMEDGYTAVKIDFSAYDENGLKTNRKDFEGLLKKSSIDLVESRLSAIREECGDALDIIVENHCRTDLNSAIQIGQLCDKYHVFFYEEVVTPMKIRQHALVREKINTPLASGERIFGRWNYANFFEENAIQVIQPDMATCGGLSEAKKICDMAHAYDIKVQAHVAGSPISLAAAIQLESAIPNFCIHEHHLTNQLPDVRESCVYDYQPVNGFIVAPDLPGIGQEFKESTLTEKCIKYCKVDEPAVVKK